MSKMWTNNSDSHYKFIHKIGLLWWSSLGEFWVVGWVTYQLPLSSSPVAGSIFPPCIFSDNKICWIQGRTEFHVLQLVLATLYTFHHCGSLHFWRCCSWDYGLKCESNASISYLISTSKKNAGSSWATRSSLLLFLKWSKSSVWFSKIQKVC